MADIFAPKRKTGKVDLTKSRASIISKPKSNQQKVEASNKNSRAKLKALGVADPTQEVEPTVLERILMPFQAGQQSAATLIKGLLDKGFRGDKELNITTSDAERKKYGAELLLKDRRTGEIEPFASPVQAFLDALQGKRSIEGTDVVRSAEKRFDFNTPGGALGEGIAGFGVDVFTDPASYGALLGLTAAGKAAFKDVARELVANGIDDVVLKGIGYSDDAIAHLVTTYGDDAGRIAADALPKSVANDIFARAGINAASNAKNGRGLLGMAGEAGDAVQYAASRAKLGLSDAAFTIPGVRRVAGGLDTLFGLGGEKSEVYRGLNSIQRAAYDSAKRTLGAKSGEYANHVGSELGDLVRKAEPDARTRMVTSLGMAREAGDVQGRRSLDRLIRARDEAALVAERATDPAMRESAGAIRDEASTDLAALLEKVRDPEATVRTLKQFDIDPSKAELSDKVRDIYSGLRQKQLDAGVPVKDLFGADSLGFAPGIDAVPRGRKTLSQLIQGKPSDIEEFNSVGKEIADSIGVNFDTLRQRGAAGEFRRSLGEIGNESKKYLTVEDRMLGWARDAEKPVAKGGVRTELDAANLVAYAGAEAQRRIARKEFGDTVKAIAGADKKAAEFLLEAEPAFTNSVALQKFIKTFDAAQGAFKKQATIWRIPAFPIRNKLSNGWLMTGNGVFDSPEDIKTYGRSPFALVGYDKKPFALGKHSVVGESIGADEAMDLARQFGAIAGKSRSELYDYQVQRGLTKWGSKINSKLVEDADRFTTFLSGLRKGLTPQAAAAYVDNTLYSYDASLLTSFERNFMRRLVPFYIWRRRNIPHMAEMLVQNPGFVTAVQKFADNMQSAYGIDDSIVPDWIREAGYVPFGSKDSPALLTLQGILPVGDLSTVKPTVADQFGQMSPLIRDPIEMAFNYDVFFGDQLEKPGRTMVKSPPIIQTLDRLLGGLERPIIPGGVTEETDPLTGKPYIATNNRFFNKAVRDASPFLGMVGRETSPRDEYDRTAAITGLRGVQYDVPSFLRSKAYEDQDALQRLLMGLKESGKVAPKKKVISKKKPKKKSLGEVLTRGSAAGR